jgi:signal-transduction protein with cAMP-binding, CBS, and nucleotidyltransferase domain
MNSHEEKVEKNYKNDKDTFTEERLNIPTLKYFWQASPLSTNKAKSIPKFLRSLKIFSNFSDYELKKFSHFLHERVFASDELIIEDGTSGFGFYIVFSGNVEVFGKRSIAKEGRAKKESTLIANLGKFEYFGEFALLENQNQRNATVISKGSSILLAIYRPDLEELIERYPIIGAKFLQGISLVVAERFNRVTGELRSVKDKLAELESQLEND